MKSVWATLIVLLLLVAGCDGGSGSDTTAVPSSTRRVATTGLELFEERVVGANPGCITCHSLERGITLVGPSLFRVESRVTGLTADEYLRQSIVEPDAYVVEGFEPGQMSTNWAEYLSSDQIDSLVELLAGMP